MNKKKWVESHLIKGHADVTMAGVIGPGDSPAIMHYGHVNVINYWIATMYNCYRVHLLITGSLFTGQLERLHLFARHHGLEGRALSAFQNAQVLLLDFDIVIKFFI